MNSALEHAKTIITQEIEKAGSTVNRILLFGSRARDEAKEDSDWDFLVIVDREIEREAKWNAILAIKRKLAALKIPNDIIVNSEEQAQMRKDHVGYITYYAIKEGVPL